MAKCKDDSIRGRVGKVIHSSWRGRPYVRACPETVSNPRTETQQAHRNAFVALSRLASYMKEGHRVGLQYQASRMNMNTFCVFKKLNSELVKADRIDYEHLFLSKGPLDDTRVTGVRMEGQNLQVTFKKDPYMTEAEGADNLYLYAYCVNLCEGRLFGPAFRFNSAITITVPEEWNGLQLHLYAFFIDSKGRSSDTIYVPFDELNVRK